MSANVKHIDGIISTIAEITKITADATTAAGDAQNKAQEVNSEAEKEERNSKQKLEQAKKAEQIAKQAYEAAKVAVVVAAAAIPFSAQALAAAESAENYAYMVYQGAQAHRTLMEGRYKMAQACRMRAAAMLAKLVSACAIHVPQTANLTNTAVLRLNAAKNDLDNFHSHKASAVNISVPSNEHTPIAKAAVCKAKEFEIGVGGGIQKSFEGQKQLDAYKAWRDYRENEDIVRPDKIHDRLNPSEDVQMGMLRDRYANDPHFKQRVDDFRERIASNDPQQVEYVKTQCKKNMAGQLSEDVIKDALSPFANKVHTQVQQVLGDGGYTKIDLVLEDMKQPVVFGKGHGMLAPKGGTVAIEVKAGQDEYLLAQKSHLDKQVQGHQSYDVSLILCTRDIKDLSSEQEYRDDIKESGSRIIGMLPRKDEINDTVWRFLNEGVK